MKVGLVLGAGGVVGRAYHAGALAALYDVLRWDARDADVIVGTSAGSLDGALLRAGLAARDLGARAADEPISAEARNLLRHAPAPMETARSFPWSGRWRPSSPGCFVRAVRRPWKVSLGALAAAALPEGVVPMRPVHELFDPLFGTSWPTRPLWINTVQLENGHRVVFGRDRDAPRATVGEAVAASCAIPGWFCPVRVDGGRFVDGGAWSLTNGDLLAGQKLDLVVVSSPMSARRSAWRTTIDGALRATSSLRLRAEMVRVRMRCPVLVLEPGADDLRVMGTLADAMDGRRRVAVARQVRRSVSERLHRLEGASVLGQAARVAVRAS